MTTSSTSVEALWAPAACTLQSVERPLRQREFDELFSEAVTAVERLDPVTMRLTLRPDPQIAARAAELCTREISCCTFFSFTISITEAAVTVHLSVPIARLDVLDAMAARAKRLSPVGSA